MLIRSLQAATLTLFFATSGFAQSTAVPFPLDYAGFDKEASSHRMVNNANAILELQLYQEVRLTSVPTPQGVLVEVDLKRAPSRPPRWFGAQRLGR
jgi:hypothetical protein